MTLVDAGLLVLVVLVVVVLEVAEVLARTLVALVVLGLVTLDTGFDTDTSRRDLFCWDRAPS